MPRRTSPGHWRALSLDLEGTATMPEQQTIALLREALRALNAIPRKPLRGPYRDTYTLAAEITRHLVAQAGDDGSERR
jgi:hypothetical protein